MSDELTEAIAKERAAYQRGIDLARAEKAEADHAERESLLLETLMITKTQADQIIKLEADAAEQKRQRDECAALTAKTCAEAVEMRGALQEAEREIRRMATDFGGSFSCSTIDRIEHALGYGAGRALSAHLLLHLLEDHVVAAHVGLGG